MGRLNYNQNEEVGERETGREGTDGNICLSSSQKAITSMCACV